jgi:hypothetical protein
MHILRPIFPMLAVGASIGVSDRCAPTVVRVSTEADVATVPQPFRAEVPLKPTWLHSSLHGCTPYVSGSVSYKYDRANKLRANIDSDRVLEASYTHELGSGIVMTANYRALTPSMQECRDLYTNGTASNVGLHGKLGIMFAINA